MKKIFTISIILIFGILILFLWKNFYKNIENPEIIQNTKNQENKNSSLEIGWIVIENDEILDITDLSENNYYQFWMNIIEPRILINWFGQKIFVYENNAPIELGDNNFLIYENYNSQNNMNIKIIENSQNFSRSYVYEGMPEWWIEKNFD